MRFLAGWFEVLLGGSSSLLKAIGLRLLLVRGCNVLTSLLSAGRMPISFPQIPLQTLPLPCGPVFHSCIKFTPVSHSETTHCQPYSRAPSVIPTGVAGLFFRAVLGAPATKRRDRGKESTISQFNAQSPFLQLLSSPPIHFSYPSHSFFLLWKFFFPFDAAFPPALPLPCQ
jgi:hypothetical protein